MRSGVKISINGRTREYTGPAARATAAVLLGGCLLIVLLVPLLAFVGVFTVLTWF